MKYFVIVTALLVSTQAFATKPVDNVHNNVHNITDVDIRNTANSHSSSGVLNSGNNIGGHGGTGIGYGGHAQQHQGQDQGQTQGISNSGNSQNANSSNSEQGQSQSANNTGNAQSVAFNTPKQYHNTPNLAGLFAYPTAPCALPVGATGAGAGFGFGFNTAYINQECIKSETSKLAMALSQPQAAIEVFCTMEHALNTTVCKELNKQPVKQVSTQEVQPMRASSGNEGKTGLFGTKWDAASQQWVF